MAASDDKPSRQKQAAAPQTQSTRAQSNRVQSNRAQSNQDEVEAFLARARQFEPVRRGEGSGRLIFAMDATMSRRPTWDMALSIQSKMFHAVKLIGGLDVQLVYFRGFNECRASKWVSDADALARLMTTIDCRGGHTQIERVLVHARKEAQAGPVNALVYVGDCMEEQVDDLAHKAGELGLLHIPVFMFQEGRDRRAEYAFKEVARLSGGAWCPFDAGAADQLCDLLKAVAVYAAGGRAALEDMSGTSGRATQLLLEQLK